MKNHLRVRGQDAHAVGSGGLMPLIQNILQTSPYCHVSPQTLRQPLPVTAPMPGAGTTPHPNSRSQTCFSAMQITTLCQRQSAKTKQQMVEHLHCSFARAHLRFFLSRAGEMDGEPSSGKKITTNFASKPVSLLCFLRDSSGQRSIDSFIHFIIPYQIFSTNFTHIIPA